jgi:DNA repair exonuclease SbcCD nuclease subunit
MVRFIHTADLQLGMTRRFLDVDAQARYTQARIDTLAGIGALAAREGAAFVVVAGDVFETNRVRPRTVGRALEAMAGIPVPVLLLPGNHDPLDAASVYLSPTFARQRPPNVLVLDGQAPIQPPGSDGVQVIGATWTTKRPLTDLAAAAIDALTPDPAVERILVAHGPIDFRGEVHEPFTIRQAVLEAAVADHRVSYVALGDRHSTTAIGATGRIWYPGSPEPTAHDETGAGSVLLVDLDGGTCEVTPRPIGTWRFVSETLELDASSGVDSLRDRLDALPAKDRTIVRLTLKGLVSLTEHARLQRTIEEAREVFGSVEEWEPSSELHVRPDDDDFADLGLSGFASAAVARLRAMATGTGTDAGTARDALSLLVRLSDPQGGGSNGRGAP